MEATEWTKLTARVACEDLECAAAVMSMLDNGLMIEDYSDFSFEGMYGTLVDESILQADKTVAFVSIFVPREKSLGDYIAFLRERFSASGIRADILTEGVNEEDWAESWKKYYAPVPIGGVTIVPSWQDYTARRDEIVVRMDPGMAFGSGTHETTRLAILLLEDTVRGGERLLDVGCGSGILSIVASRLGAGLCRAYDIDPVAVRVAEENVRADGAAHVECGVSDLLSGVAPIDGGYDVAVANIVADILLRMAPDISGYLHPGAAYITSGIIEPRLGEVTAAMTALGFAVEKVISENDWYAVRFRL